MLEGAQKDYLTDFFAREALSPFLETLIHDATASNAPFSVALIDLDRFKKFNDKFGHDFGDEILKYAASTFRLTLEDNCYFFRYGGDEFVLIFPKLNAKDTFHLMRICARNMIVRPFLYKNRFYRITFSCGISAFPADDTAMDDLIKKADTAMYFSKRHGHNLTTLAGKMKYITLRNISVLAVCTFVTIFSFTWLYRNVFKIFVSYTLEQIQKIRFVMEPKELDAIILKNGVVYKGYIFEELDDRVVFYLELKQGEGMIVLNKDDIAKIKYSAQKTNEERESND